MKTIKNTFVLGIICAAGVVSSTAHELETNENSLKKSVKAQTERDCYVLF